MVPFHAGYVVCHWPSSRLRLLVERVEGLGVVAGTDVVDPDGAVCITDICRIDEKVVDTAVEVLVGDDDAVCHEIAGETQVVASCVGSEDREGVGEETGGEEDGGDDEGVM